MTSWLKSKLLHAGWRADSKIQDPPEYFVHEDWKIKSYETIRQWIYNRYMYHNKLELYFSKRKDILTIDITSDKNPVEKIVRFLDLDGVIVKNNFYWFENFHNRLRGYRLIPNNMPKENMRKTGDYVRQQDIDFCFEVASRMVGEMSAYAEEDEARLARMTRHL